MEIMILPNLRALATKNINRCYLLKSKKMKKDTIKLKSILIILLAFAINTNAQDTKVTADLEMWNSISVSKKISDRWKVSLSEELRFTEDISRFDIFFTEMELAYKINKHISTEFGYRFYQNKNSDDEFFSQHRFSLGLAYKQKLDRFTLGYKLKFQNKDEDFLSSSSTSNVSNLRNKLSVDYNINHFKLEPFFNVELFRKYETDEDSYFSKLRWTLGASYPVTKKSDVQLFYRLDNELNQTYAKDTYILGLGYKISF